MSKKNNINNDELKTEEIKYEEGFDQYGPGHGLKVDSIIDEPNPEQLTNLISDKDENKEEDLQLKLNNDEKEQSLELDIEQQLEIEDVATQQVDTIQKVGYLPY